MKLFKTLKSNRKKAISHKSFLRRGWYVLLPNMRTYVNLCVYKEMKESFPKERTSIKAYIKRVLALRYSFWVKSSGDFAGEAAYFSTVENEEYKDCKIFSFKSSEVAVFAANQERFALYQKNRTRNTERFPMPKLYVLDPNREFYVEEYLHHKALCPNELEELMGALIEFFSKYYQKCDFKNDYSHGIDFSEQMYPVSPNIKLYLHHADLSIDNVIYRTAEKRFWMIDFDHEDYYPAFYDVFFLMWNSAVSDNNMFLLNSFNTAKFDHMFANYFEENVDGMIEAIKNAATFLWNRRLKDIPKEKQEKWREVLQNTVACAEKRMVR